MHVSTQHCHVGIFLSVLMVASLNYTAVTGTNFFLPFTVGHAEAENCKPAFPTSVRLCLLSR